ncbi:PREDICTED: protein CHROMATIN REMODELING 4-like [Nelumbo nucifera]|uniref:Protein CHROMATIN REMODELING 4-like n=2 Tax=Nelumbo nucifera TaxID=4432 RepID=A0A1U7Z8J8_NELNU|nr:PREDICTED: protein CHROMATIN REMODELING 4-like [Nelumbo nucifera]XP_010243974.1 PREDICTED: protein CHROMATIN REMODELING 4-like [Nelumbo nucifera]DAD20191.1 TPA_asm: hypothetical protein HUJ06_021654 [Nelumbo nucifera]
MINNKAVLTYKRKRTSSKPGLSGGIQYSSQHEESSKKCLAANEKGDAGLCIKSSDNGGKLLHCDICLQPYNLQCNESPTEYIAHQQWLCSACAKQENSGKSQQQSGTKMERKDIEGSETRSIDLCSHKGLSMRKSIEDEHRNETGGAFQNVASSERISNYIQICSCSNMCSESTHKSPQTEASSNTLVVDIDTEININSVCLDSEGEKNASCGSPSSSVLKRVDSESTDFLSKDKSNLLCTNTHLKRKYSAPLITFSRRAKRKRHVNNTEAPNQSTIEEKRFLENDWCNSRSDVSSSHEGTSQKCSSVDQQNALIVLGEGPDVSHSVVKRKDKLNNNKEIGSGELTSGGCFQDETKIVKHMERKQCEHGYISENRLSTVEYLQGLSSTMNLSSFQAVGTETSSKATDIKVKDQRQSDLPKIGAIRQKTQVLNGVGVEETVKPVGLLGDKDSLGHLHPSIALPEPSCCEPTTGASSETSFELSKNSNNATSLHKKFNHRGKGLGSLEPIAMTVKERLSSNQTCTSRDEDDNYKDYRTTPAVLPISIYSQDLCLKRISEDIVNDMAPLACVTPEPIASMNFKGRVLPIRSRNDDNLSKPILTKPFFCPPHFLGLSLQTEPATAASTSEDHSTISSFPSFEIKQKGSVQDLMPQTGSDQLRHKLMLDSVLTRSRTFKGSQSSSENLKGYTIAWSEEELDYLWIGVRRHGRSNWEAMLRDPRLHFSTWRVARDLSARWDEEQSKLLNGTLIQPQRLISQGSPVSGSGLWTKKTAVASHYGNYYTESQRLARSDALMDETQLSLGDVYVQKDRNIPKKYTFNLPIPNLMPQTVAVNDNPDNVSCVTSNGIRNPASQKIGTKQHQKHTRCQGNQSHSGSKHARYVEGFPILQQKPLDRAAGHGLQNGELFNQGEGRGTSSHSSSPDDGSSCFPSNSNLPHWLKEVVSVPLRPMESSVPPDILSMKQSLSLLYNGQKQVVLPFSSPDALSIQQKNPQGLMMSRINKSGSLRASELLPHTANSNFSLMGPRLNHHSGTSSNSLMPEFENQNIKIGLADPNPTYLHPVTTKQDGLIVIDSDASSEETISDDQNGTLYSR